MRKKMVALLSAMLACGVAQSAYAGAEADSVEMRTYDFAVIGRDTLRADVYLRSDLRDSTRLPVMIYVHGGGFVGGSRINAAQEVFLRHYAQRGWLSVSVDYRLGGMTEQQPVSKYGCKSTLEVIRLAARDFVNATAWILHTFPVDSSRIVCAGGSAGAFTVMQTEYDLCNDSAYVRAALPADFNYAGVVAAAGTINTGLRDSLTWKHEPCPMFLLQGDSDRVVYEAAGPQLGMRMYGAKSLHKIFSEKKFPHWVYIERGADHVVAMKHLTDNLEETDKFLREFVDGKKRSTVYTEWRDTPAASMKDAAAMVKYVPLYILGYGKYLRELKGGGAAAADKVVY